jgi:fucose permease
MWGIGATMGPYIMGWVLSDGKNWPMGYRLIFIIQLMFALILLVSLPIWKTKAESGNENADKAMPFREIISIPGVKNIMAAFFCYCALEQTSGLWASSYLVLHKGIDTETAAFFGSIFFLGITVGRALNGFLAEKFKDSQLIKMGMVIIASGIIAMLIHVGECFALFGLILIGLGCAPIYPCIIHSTPLNFGADKSQAIVGVEMASAYIGNIIMPPLFGLLAEHISISLMPFYLLIVLCCMWYMHSSMLRKCASEN